MKKILTISTLALLTSSFIAGQALAAPDAARTTTSTIIAQQRAKDSLRNKKHPAESSVSVETAARKLAGKRIKKELSKISWTEHKKIGKVIVVGNKSISTDDLKEIIEPYLKDGVTRKEAQAITDEIEDYYIEEGYFLPVAHLEIKGSTLKITVVEGVIRDVLVVLEDEKRDQKVLSNKRFLELVEKIEKANPLKTRDLERYLLLINKIHGYSADYELEPFDDPVGNNIADLIMTVGTQKGTANFSVDNAGTHDLGREQINFSGQAFNPIANDSLIFSLGTTNRPNRFRLATAGYLKRLNSYGTSANIFGSYMENDPFKTPGSKYSRSTIIKGELEHYAVLNNDCSIKLELTADGRHMRNYAQTLKLSDYQYVMGTFGGKIKIVDPLEVENWFYPYYNWTLNRVNYRADSLQPRDFDRNFNFFIIDWYRNQPLPKNFSFFLKASYQTTNRLLPTEHRYAINTGHTGRGYNPGLISADQGVTGVAELRYTKEFEGDKIKKLLEIAQIFGFYDVTHFINHNKDENRRQHPGAIFFNRSTLPAAGAGVRLFLSHGFYGEGTAEYPLQRNIAINGETRRNKPVYRLVFNKEFNW